MQVRSLTPIKKTANLIRHAHCIVVLTGAGISTPSGIPDFRSSHGGLWTRYDPMEVASLSAFRRNPQQFYAWLHPLARDIAQAKPNPAHIALAQIESGGYPLTIITQNIDGLHTRAGSQRVLEVHGSFQTLSCTRCFESHDATPYIDPYIESGEIPYCPKCGAILKPDIILFQEQLPYQTFVKAREACCKCDLMIVVGSSLEVIPVAGLPVLALNNNASLIILNNTPTYVDVRASVVIQEDVAISLPHIAEEVLHG
ncbi:MAG: NAD-dependent deacylase [Chloroflexota bacterium]